MVRSGDYHDKLSAGSVFVGPAITPSEQKNQEKYLHFQFNFEDWGLFTIHKWSVKTCVNFK